MEFLCDFNSNDSSFPFSNASPFVVSISTEFPADCVGKYFIHLILLRVEYIKKMWNSGRNGIGDKMDKLNLWLLPWFTLVFFAAIWTTKWTNIAFEHSTCHLGSAKHNFEEGNRNVWAKGLCERTALWHYYAGENQQYWLNFDPKLGVNNPAHVLFFWVPFVFVIWFTRFLWFCLMVGNRGINFGSIIDSSKFVKVNKHVLPVIPRNLLMLTFSSGRFTHITYQSTSVSLFVAFLAFEFWLVLAPLSLLLIFLPLEIGAGFRTWGLDILRTWWEGRDWQGSPLIPFFGHSTTNSISVPLFPRITYCYSETFIGIRSDIFPYICQLETKWHERTALLIWAMLVLLAILNLGNFILWLHWGIRMRSPIKRQNWVIEKWLNSEGLSNADLDLDMCNFAERFNMEELLYIYYIKCHFDRHVAIAYCMALFEKWKLMERIRIDLERPSGNRQRDAGVIQCNVIRRRVWGKGH